MCDWYCPYDRPLLVFAYYYSFCTKWELKNHAGSY
jgi:hypothetical protein